MVREVREGREAWEASGEKAAGAVRIPPDEAASARVAQVLNDNGFESAKALVGGFDAWQDAGLPVEPK